MAYKSGHLIGCQIAMAAAGTIEPEQRRKADAHMQECDDCRKAVLDQQVSDFMLAFRLDETALAFAASLRPRLVAVNRLTIPTRPVRLVRVA